MNFLFWTVLTAFLFNFGPGPCGSNSNSNSRGFNIDESTDNVRNWSTLPSTITGSSFNISSICTTLAAVSPVVVDDNEPVPKKRIRVLNDKRSLLTISHPIFDISDGISPSIIYQVSIEVEALHEFLLEWRISGATGEESHHLKRRHQRDRREVLELIRNLSTSGLPNPPPSFSTETSSESSENFQTQNELISCSKSSLGGVNLDSTSTTYTFHWFINPQNSIPQNENSANFRLRFRSVSTTAFEDSDSTFGPIVVEPIYEQNLSISVKPSCQLRLKVGENTRISLETLLNPHLDKNTGLNCSISISPLIPTYGLEARLRNLSIYGIRDLCKGRFISLKTSQISKSQDFSVNPIQSNNIGSGSESENDPDSFIPQKFPNFQNLRFCGKLEDYQHDERTLVFKSTTNFSLFLQISLPSTVYPRESFDFELFSLSPCSKVRLSELDGVYKYKRPQLNQYNYLNSGKETVDCSIHIHLPWGYKISTLISLESKYSGGNGSKNVKNGSKILDELNEECSNDTSNTSNTNSSSVLMHILDLSSGVGLSWCWDTGQGSSISTSRSFTSSGNQVRITFKLGFGQTFSLRYEGQGIEEIVGDCDRGWSRGFDGGGCLALFEIEKSWTEAEEFCSEHGGGHLISFKDQVVEQKVEKIVLESSQFHPSRAYWIGANDWFGGWSLGGSNSGNNGNGLKSPILNSQPNDDGFSGQDCVELRQGFKQISYESHGKTSKGQKSSKDHQNQNQNQLKSPWAGQQSQQGSQKFYWNDRNCRVKNYFICEKTLHQSIGLVCNQTLSISPSQDTLHVTSPSYPNSYSDNTLCITKIETLPGHKIIIEFEDFYLEESPGCKYDSVEISEIRRQTEGENSVKRICGDWSRKLKLLRYKQEFKSSSEISIKFESDFSHSYPGFKAKIYAEREIGEGCSEQHMQKWGSHCYLFVSFPAVPWKTANQICTSLKGQLASVLGPDEWIFISRNLLLLPKSDKKAIFWLGGQIDSNSRLVWSDQMPFNFSAFHPSDLQTISDWKCLSIYWHGAGKGDFAWRLADCSQLAGYICKKNAKVELSLPVNRTYSGTSGRITSANYPGTYPTNLDYSSTLKSPIGTQIVLRFIHLDLEYQEDCLYDYVEIIDKNTQNSTRYCGTHLTTQDLNKLDFVGSNEVEVYFHTDYIEGHSGFEIVWRAVDVTGCLAGRTILVGDGNELKANLNGNFAIHESTIHTPNFPHFNLPNLNCYYTLVAPAGQRIWLHFQVFELGRNPTGDCDPAEDHIVIDLGQNLGRNSELLLCGNLTNSPQNTAFLSYEEKIRIRINSPEGKTGRGFLGLFKAIKGPLNEKITVEIPRENSTLSLKSLNFPLNPPSQANLTISLISPPNYIFTFRVKGSSYPNCHQNMGNKNKNHGVTNQNQNQKGGTFLEIHDPFVGVNGSSWLICRPEETPSVFTRKFSNSGENLDEQGEVLEGSISREIDSALSIHSTFNRIEVKQIYPAGGNTLLGILIGSGIVENNRWNAEIRTSLDENFRDKVLAGGDRLLLLNACTPNPCVNGGKCTSDGEKHICRCQVPFTGPFCGLTLCDLNPCLFGQCILEEKSFRCDCQPGYGGMKCDRRRKPCDENPCGHGDCVETTNTTFKCVCHAWMTGPTCESRMMHIPYKPLTERMIQEPFWLGLLTVACVLGLIGLVWCLKRHFPEKLEKILNEDPDRNRGISWGSTYGYSKEPIAGPSGQPASPVASRGLLGRLGLRKPSLLSLSSGASVSISASPHQYENRTFSLDDLLRPTIRGGGVSRTPSPHKRRNFSSMHVRRNNPEEKRAILQGLVSSTSQSLDGDAKPTTPKPTIAEIIQMSERRLRLASAISNQTESAPNSLQVSDAETSFSNMPGTATLTAQQKIEKKVTFARLLDKLAATDMTTSSSSCSDVSCPEDCASSKTIPPPPKLLTKKERKARFRRANKYQRGRTSETDLESCMDMSSSDTTPDPIYTPRFPSRSLGQGQCSSPTGSQGQSQGQNLSLSKDKPSKMGSAESLISLFKRFSGQSSSAPPSPQYSDNDDSSAVGTPLSNPGSPRSSQLSLRINPPAFQITSAISNSNFEPQDPNSIEVPILDPFSQTANWHRGSSSSSAGGTSITLEVPMREYCLSPIHEMPTPLPTPSHTPAHSPMMQRMVHHPVPQIKVQMSEDEENSLEKQKMEDNYSSALAAEHKKFDIPQISIETTHDENPQNDVQSRPFPTIRVEHDDSENSINSGENMPDVLINVPPDAPLEGKPENEFNFENIDEQSRSGTPLGSPKIKNKPPPLVFANEILSSYYMNQENLKKNNTNKDSTSSNGESPDHNCSNRMIVPVLNVENATPDGDFPQDFDLGNKISGKWDNINNMNSCTSPGSPGIRGNKHMMPMITINQISEAESDSDTPIMKFMNQKRPNLSFLSPFVGNLTSDRVPSESNLSTSGYSSMASPCPSRCPSSSPLCPLESDDTSSYQGHNSHFPRRSSLTSHISICCSQNHPTTCGGLGLNSSRKGSLPSRRCSFNAPSTTLGDFIESEGNLDEDQDCEISSQKSFNQIDEIETDSAVDTEVGHETDCDTENGKNSQQQQDAENSLQIPRKHIPKSKSLEICPNSSLINRLKTVGESLDSKLNTQQQGSCQSLMCKMQKTPMPFLSVLKDLRDPNFSKNCKKLSPVSSRSDSPTSEVSNLGVNTVGITDSDGIYDPPSSTNGGSSSVLNGPNYQQQMRRSGRRRERREKGGKKSANLLSASAISLGSSPTDKKCGEKNLNCELLPPAFLHGGGNSRRCASAKRRLLRAQSKLGVCSSSSSSSEDLSTSRNSRNSSNERLRSPKSPVNLSRSLDRIYQSSDKSISPKSAASSSTCNNRPPRTISSLSSENLSQNQNVEVEVELLENKHNSAEEISNVIPSSVPKKISRLRAISHQIRFLRRLELRLIRKREILTVSVNRDVAINERRESLLISGSSDSEICESSLEENTNTQNIDEEVEENEENLTQKSPSISVRVEPEDCDSKASEPVEKLKNPSPNSPLLPSNSKSNSAIDTDVYP